MRTALFTTIFSLAVVAGLDAVEAQQVVTNDVSQTVLESLQGTWQPTEINVNGQTQKNSYGSSVFAGHQWTLSNSNGDYVYEISAIQVRPDLNEFTFTDHKAKRSFVGLVQLYDDELTITRGLRPKKGEDGFAAIPCPDSIEPGTNKLVYRWKRADAAAELSSRPTLTIRIFENGVAEKEFARYSIRSFIGGKLEYSDCIDSDPQATGGIENFGTSEDNPFQIGTYISGTIEDAVDGKNLVHLVIKLGHAEETKTPDTVVVQSEVLAIQTLLKSDEATRVKCGGDRWCELLIR